MVTIVALCEIRQVDPHTHVFKVCLCPESADSVEHFISNQMALFILLFLVWWYPLVTGVTFIGRLGLHLLTPYRTPARGK